MFKAWVHASEILTGRGVRKKDGRKIKEEDLGRIPDGAIVCSLKKIGKRTVPDRIEWVGPTSSLPKKWGVEEIETVDLQNRRALIPGLVDCHTHLIFAGDRSEEFAARCAGATYQEIARQGGGIQRTVAATRDATSKDLERLASQRLREADSFGVRTLEIKSGYGLSLESELKILQVIPRLRQKFPQMKIKSTFLGAHAFPSDLSRQAYLDELIYKMLPEVARLRLADSCDVFVDDGYFTTDEARQILSYAKELGLKIKIHADELGNTESAALAVEMEALSADHLLKISDQGIQKLANSSTVAVLLPGTAFYLKAAHAPARRLIEAGAVVALATDFNPGTCMCLSLPAMMTLAGLYLSMSPAEIFASVTYNGAKALGLANQTGTLEPGKDADFAVLPFAKFEEMYYRFGWSPSFF